jgi:hypothetical protein
MVQHRLNRQPAAPLPPVPAGTFPLRPLLSAAICLGAVAVVLALDFLAQFGIFGDARSTWECGTCGMEKLAAGKEKSVFDNRRPAGPPLGHLVDPDDRPSDLRDEMCPQDATYAARDFDPFAGRHFDVSGLDVEAMVPGPIGVPERDDIDSWASIVEPPLGFQSLPDTGMGGWVIGGVCRPFRNEGVFRPFRVGRRNGANRERLLREGGGNTWSEAVVSRGLKWVARHQFNDGHWDLHDFADACKCNCGNPGLAGHEVAGTAFGLLPLLGAGETHQPAGLPSKHTKNVEMGLEWLLKQQGGDGQFGDGYAHALATLVLCEAYGMTSDPKLKPHAQLAVDKIVEWQGKDGGFRYSPKDDGDLSVTGWHVQALRSAQLAGLKVPQATLKGVDDFLNKVGNEDGSEYGYTGPQVRPRLTAVGLLCRQYRGVSGRSKALASGIKVLQKQPPTAKVKDIYYYYHATQVMRYLAPIYPDEWKAWNDGPNGMRDRLVYSQDDGSGEKDQRGSWDPTGDVLEKQLGRLGYTSLCLLSLEVYYRHLPIRGERWAELDGRILNP